MIATREFILGLRDGVGSVLKGILGTLSFLYLLAPTGGLVELLPDAAPLIGHLDEFVATFFFTRILGFKPGEGPGNGGKPTPQALLGYTMAGVLGGLYLIAPTFSLFELLPDAIPVLGNLDEMLAATMVLALSRVWGRLIGDGTGRKRQQDDDISERVE